MGLILRVVKPLKTYVALAVHAYYQHIHIVKAALAAVGEYALLLFGKTFDRRPRVNNIAC